MPMLPNPLIIPVGLALGVLVAAPVGPVNILCIQRTISAGVLAGICAGLGAVLGDGLIALIASMSVGQVTSAIHTYRDVIQLVGGAALIGFGIWLYRSHLQTIKSDDAALLKPSAKELFAVVPKTFLLTITNPAAVLGLVAIFGGVSSFVEVRGRVDALTLVAALMAGSLCWWVFLATMVGQIRGKLSASHLVLINKVAGLALLGFGGLMVGEIAWKAMRA